jgi:hypothetical protein
VQLYVGSTGEFVEDSIQHRLSEKISDSFYDYYGYRNVSELQAWESSLSAMAMQISHADLFDHGIVVEMELPLASSRLDCMIFGRDRALHPSAMLIELKQWTKIKPSDVDGCVQAYVGGAERTLLHPSIQALRYAEYLTDSHEGYGDGGVAIRPASYLHNMRPLDAQYLRSTAFDDLMDRAPLFVGRDADVFADAMHLVLGNGDGNEIMRRALSRPAKPSRKLLEHTAAMIAGEPRYTLLDEQEVAYRTVLAQVRRAIRNKKDHSVVVIKGGPGTGKSVIALNLVGALSKVGVDVRHATGSKAFTETLWSVLGNKSKPQFRYFNQFGSADEGGIDVLICDEAHRIRQSSNSWLTPKAKRSDRAQVDELITAAKTTVFFLDDFQAVRPEEIGSVQLIRERAAASDAQYRQVDLRSQFRCAGSESYLEWLEQLLEINKTGRFTLPPDDPFEFEIVGTPAELDLAIRQKIAEGHSARLVAGYCWKWSKPTDTGELVDDIVIGDFRRPWNAQPGQHKLAAGIPPAPLWAWSPGGVNQVGCIYTAQGFEFDYAGVIFGSDLVVRDGIWVGQPTASYDAQIKRKSNPRFAECVKNAYRVLLTRGLKGCFVSFLDEETCAYVKERL